MELFYGFTTTTIGNGNKASFWDDSWVDGIRPKVLAPSIYAISRQKTSSVRNAITDDAWVRHLDTSTDLSVQHLQEFTTLLGHTSQLILHDDISDSITSKLTCNRVYSCSSAYSGHIEGTIRSNMDRVVWKIWAPLSAKSSYGSSSKTELGLVTDSHDADGQMVAFAP
jgi:hypothetical protein